MRWCQVCDRELRTNERLGGLLRPFGLPFRKKRVRWACRRCLKRVAATRSIPSLVPSHAYVAVQRLDLQWFAGRGADGQAEWSASRRSAVSFEDEEAARQAIVKLRAEGHHAHSVMLFRRS